MHLNVGLVSQQAGNHELGTVTDGVDGRVFDNDTLKVGEEGFEGTDDAAEVGFYPSAWIGLAAQIS